MRLIGLTVLVIAASLAQAATLAEEQDILARLEQSLENRQASLEEVENDLLGYRNKLAEAEADLEQAQTDLASAEAQLAAARSAFEADAGQDNSRALKKAEHSHKMAERGVRSRTKRLERVSRNTRELEAQLAAGKSGIASVKNQIRRQEKRLSDMTAGLAQQADQDATAAAVTRVDPLVPDASPRAPTVAKPAPRSAAPQPAAGNALQAATQASELDREALAYAQREMSRLEAYLAGGEPGRPSYRRLLLRGSKVKATAFEFLGRNQYRAEVPVSAGKQLFEVGSHKFRRTIPTSDDGQVYVFIYDARRLSRPRLAVFKKSLLEHI